MPGVVPGNELYRLQALRWQLQTLSIAGLSGLLIISEKGTLTSRLQFRTGEFAHRRSHPDDHALDSLAASLR